jgi:hypothetical protein
MNILISFYLLLNKLRIIYYFFYGRKYIGYYSINKGIHINFHYIINYFPYPFNHLLILLFYCSYSPYLFKERGKVYFSTMYPDCNIYFLPPIIKIMDGDDDVKNKIMEFHPTTPLNIVLKYHMLEYSSFEIDVENSKHKSIYEIINNKI